MGISQRDGESVAQFADSLSPVIEQQQKKLLISQNIIHLNDWVT